MDDQPQSICKGFLLAFMGTVLAACGGGNSNTHSDAGASNPLPDSPAYVSEDITGPNGTRYAYLQPGYRLPLHHQHGSDLLLFGQQPTETYHNSLLPEFHSFDVNGWVQRKITIDFEGWAINGARQFDDSLWLDNAHLPPSSQVHAAYPHQRLDRLAFVSLDTQSQSGNYRLLDFGQAPGSFGRWSTIQIDKGWLLARAIRTTQTGSPGYSRIQLQVIKLDTNGQLTGNRLMDTANIPGFGSAQVRSDSTYLPYIYLERHFNDVLVSGFAFGMQPAQGNPLQSISQMWLALDPENLRLQRSFWLQADRLTRSASGGQPDLNLRQWQAYGTLLKRAWQPHDTFVLTPDYRNYNTQALNQGWLRGQLSADYNAFNLTAFGLRQGTATYSVSHFWWTPQPLQLEVPLPDNRKGTLVGDVSGVYPLPETRHQQPECTGAAGFGRFAQSSDCQRFDSFYAFNTNGLMVVRNIPASLSVSNAWDTTAWNNGDEIYRAVHLTHPTSSEGVSLDLDAGHRHPGCTTDRPYAPAAVPVLSSPEQAQVRTTTNPAVIDAAASQQSGPLRVHVQPYQYRAPVLCSQYKVSLDQRLTVPRSTDSRPTSVQPVLHAAYARQVLTLPVNGSYDVSTNTYRPRNGFTGSDSLRIRINDTTGEQDVLVQITVQ